MIESSAPENNATGDEPERDILFNVINRFVGLYARESSKSTENDVSREYPFVAMDTRQIFEQIRFVHHFLAMPDDPIGKPTHSFLDIGCGIGNILLFAEQFGFDAHGIEKDTYPFKIAERLIGSDKVTQADIWNYDRYGDFDVIYYFRPFSEREPQKRFEKMIENRIKTGAILIANHKNSDDIERDKRFQRLSKTLPIWQKSSD